MDIQDRIKSEEAKSGIFIAIGGHRLAGKSTLAGTLPGKTLMLQAAGLETGSRSAKSLAKRNGNVIDVIDVENLKDAIAIIDKISKDQYDNIYIDSISSLLDIQFKIEGMDKLKGNNIWEGFRKLGDVGKLFMLKCKEKADKEGINVCVTMAYKIKTDSDGDVTDVQYDMKGNVTLSTLHGVCPIIVTVGKINTEKEGAVRCLYTYDYDKYPGRIDYLLEDENPKVIKPDLSLVLKLVTC